MPSYDLHIVFSAGLGAHFKRQAFWLSVETCAGVQDITSSARGLGAPRSVPLFVHREEQIVPELWRR